MIRSMTFAIGAAAALLLSCEEPGLAPKAEFGPEAKVPVNSSQDAGIAITVATWNVEGLDLGGKAPAGTYTGVAAALRNASVEVAALEEVQTEDLEALRSALTASGCDLPYYRLSRESDGYNAALLLSKYPISESQEILLPSRGSWPRSVLKARVDIGRGLAVYICHLKSGESYSGTRIEQARALGSYLRESYGSAIDDEVVAVLGDMNTMSPADRSGLGSTLSLLELRDDAFPDNDFSSMSETLLPVSESYSWEGWVSGTWTRSSLDHIILSPAAKARFVAGSLRVYRSDPSGSMSANSDHYPVVLDITL